MHIASLEIGTQKVVALIADLKPNKKIDIIGFSKQQHKGAIRGIIFK